MNKSICNNCKLLGYYMLAVLCIASCESNDDGTHTMSLDTKYAQINEIHSFANCKGPNGQYTTEVTSTKDGYLFFSQVFENGRDPFNAELSTDGKGLIVNENKIMLDSLSSNSVVMIRSHDFHRLQTNPNYFFDDIEFEKSIDEKIDLYSAVDKLNNPVKINYDNSIQQLRSIKFLNMMDTSQVIQIINKEWLDSDYGKMVKELEIIQAGKDTFNFVFETIKINS